MTNKPLKIHG